MIWNEHNWHAPMWPMHLHWFIDVCIGQQQFSQFHFLCKQNMLGNWLADHNVVPFFVCKDLVNAFKCSLRCDEMKQRAKIRQNCTNIAACLRILHIWLIKDLKFRFVVFSMSAIPNNFGCRSSRIVQVERFYLNKTIVLKSLMFGTFWNDNWLHPNGNTRALQIQFFRHFS